MTDNTFFMLSKLNKCLDKRYHFTYPELNYANTILSLRELLALNIFTSKHFAIIDYSKKKIDFEYRKLVKPKIEYYLNYGEIYCILVPKLVYDYLDIPVKE